MKKPLFFTFATAILFIASFLVFPRGSSEASSETALPRPAPGALLPIEGAYNIRDLGGYRTEEGKTVRWDLVFRAGELDKLTPGDVAHFEELGIKTIVDFRDTEERAAAPDAPISTVKNNYHFPIDGGSSWFFGILARLSPEQTFGCLVDSN
ncbi:MAG: tyrosine-protein phosphatase, partial [Spirochaetales bacterium]|nr:tyrosine-protein phosphatase [Spirochaetales bacterium]